ncbi:MAG: DUF3943 domain-containing protein [Candidatus Aminicenantes bacterium]|nr:DUF3943 domain-containing protein [Candidatus Aminicenantes bacterium]
MSRGETGRPTGLNWIKALPALAGFIALLGGGSAVYAGRLPGRGIPPTFHLSSYQAGFDSNEGGGFGLLPFSLQQQPFVEPDVRLRDDDPAFIKKSLPGGVAFRVFSSNVLTWAMDRFIMGYPWARVGLTSWKNNFLKGWQWDIDPFNTNFFFHPYSGGAFFNSARSNGYGYFSSVPFALMGSLMWEYFGETGRPAYNDLINTTLSGSLFGEIFYRLSSSLLDDRATGVERFFREFGALLLSPGRAFSRLLQGKLTRVTTKEIYQKEPINISASAGAHWFNQGSRFGTGSLSANLNIHLDYGDPFEIRPRKPFDFFKIRTDLSYGKNMGKRYLDNFIGYGLLFGKTVHSGSMDLLMGVFQHYNYWDSKIFQISTLAFGGGLIAKWRLSEESNLQAAFHLGLIPLGASDSPYIDLMEAGEHVRNYNYAGGAEAKIESTLNLTTFGQLTAIFYFYRLYNFVGPAGHNNIMVFKPRLAIKLVDNINLGFEFLYYYKEGYYLHLPDIKKSNSEQKLYLMLYF